MLKDSKGENSKQKKTQKQKKEKICTNPLRVSFSVPKKIKHCETEINT